jgi:hypothetical protein
MPFKPRFNITPKINKTLMETERVRGFLEAIKLKDDWLADMRQEALIKAVIKSVIEPTKHYVLL